MPLACDPDRTFDVSLKIDKQVDPDRRPTFQVKHLTCREFMRAADVMDNLHESKDRFMAIQNIKAVLANHVKGWRNMPDPKQPGKMLDFDVIEIDAVLTQLEMQELVYAIMAGARPSGEDLGKSDAQP
jgi:hypothetical protein